MAKFKLALGLHNHQPVGNFDSVFEDAHRQAYRPFLELVGKYPSIKLSLHQSGILWDWQERHHPEHMDLVRELVQSGQIELMTGGFYEPILPSIPNGDKSGQIAMLTEYLRAKFACEPEGLWLTERVWEPQLPKILNMANVKYVPIDDTHFLYAGFEPDDLRGAFVTEDEGYSLVLLPILKKLRYLIPFGTVKKVMAELRARAERYPDGLAIYADDGEKFGVWPDTYKHCYDDGWLDDFFEALSQNTDWLEVCTLGEAARTVSMGQAYLPTASYAEMLHWSLPARAFVEYEEFESHLKAGGLLERFGRFVRGGHWRGFLAKYDESNQMHKRMLTVSRLLDKYCAEHPSDKKTISEARRYLYAGQCNCPYWHGVFGGLYLPHIRQAIFENLIKAEKLLFDADDWVHMISTDYDCDGHDEVIARTDKFAAFFKPSRGGALVELDSYDLDFNLTDTLRRRIEGYHGKLARARKASDVKPTDSGETNSIHDLILTKEDGLDKLLVNDWYPRRCFVDHFLSGDSNLPGFAAGQFHDEGDFVLEPYQYSTRSDKNSLTLVRDGNIWRFGRPLKLQLEKRFFFSPKSDVISANYRLTALNEDIPHLRLAIENNFNFQAGHADDRYLLFNGERKGENYLDSVGRYSECRSVIMRDDWRGLTMALAFDKDVELWQVPIFTVSLSEGGFEKVYQGTSLVSIIPVDLKAGQSFEMTILLFAGKTAAMPPRFLTHVQREAMK